MGDLETYLEKHAGLHAGDNINRPIETIRAIEDCLIAEDSYKNYKYRNVLVRDDTLGRIFGTASFVACEPNLEFTRLVYSGSYKNDPAKFKKALIESGKYLSLSFGRIVKATLMTYGAFNRGYALRYGTWGIRGNDVLVPKCRDFREFEIRYKNGGLVKGLSRMARVKNGTHS